MGLFDNIGAFSQPSGWLSALLQNPELLNPGGITPSNGFGGGPGLSQQDFNGRFGGQPQQAQQPPGPIDGMFGGLGLPQSAMGGGAGGGVFPSMPPQAANAMAQAPQAPQMPQQQQLGAPQPLGTGDRLSAGAGNFSDPSVGLIGRLANSFQGLATGQRTDPRGMAQQSQTATLQALIRSGVPPAIAQAAALNPEILKTIAPAYFDTAPKVQVIKDMMGGETPYFVKTGGANPSMTPALGGGQPGGFAGMPSNATPEELTAAVDKQYPGAAARAEQIFNGEGGVPNSRQNKIDGPAMQLLLKTHPDWSMNTWTAKNKMISGLSNTTPSSAGGRLQSLRNAFDHLANSSDAAVEKGNLDLGVSPLSSVANQLKSMTTSQRDIQAKLEREAVTYGGERTKFLTGSEGSEAERRAFVESLGPTKAAPPQMAGTLEGEYTQLKSALVNQEQQVREQLGEEYLKKHPIITPEVKHSMERLERNIEKLRHGGGESAAGPQAAPQTATGPNGQKLILRGNQWVPMK